MSREDLDVSRTDQSPTRLHLRRFDTPCMAQSGEKDHGAAPGNHAWTKPAATALSSTRCHAATPASIFADSTTGSAEDRILDLGVGTAYTCNWIADDLINLRLAGTKSNRYVDCCGLRERLVGGR